MTHSEQMRARQPERITNADQAATTTANGSGVKDLQLVPVPHTQLEIIERMASSPSTNIDALERLIALYERATARREEIAFNAAMSQAQKEMRPIAADAANPQTRSRYASYGKLDAGVRPIYTAHGFGLSFDTADSPLIDHVRVLCYVTHADGHARTYKTDMPADGKGAKGGDVMTKTHAVGAAMSYGMRYLLKMIFNIAVGEDDRDGNVVEPERASDAPAGFDAWEDAIDALVLAGCTRAQLNAKWEAGGEATEPFRRYIARTNIDHVEGWKKACTGAK
jgi:hypothetical protein